MKKKRVRIALIISISVILVCAIAGAVFNYITNHTLPSAANEVLVDYMEALKIGTVEAAQYAYFKNNAVRTVYMNAGTILYDYRVEDITRINDQLFALTVLVKTNSTANSYMRVYNFVGYIESSWKFMNGVGNVPEEISDNLDREAYSYK